MGNTLTGLLPNIFQAVDVVSRELTGLIGASFRNSNGELVALNQEITYPLASARAAMDITPAVTSPDTGDEAVGEGKLKITKSRGVAVRWNGEEQTQVKGTGVYDQLVTNQFAQAMRTLVNEVEADLAALGKKFSRAYGTAGTTPFATAADLSDFSQPKKILLDNGCPEADLHLVIGTTAAATMEGKQSSLFKANEAGSDLLLREGIITRVQGFGLGKSAAIAAHVKGTGANYVTNTPAAATLPVGTTGIPIDTGTGTVVAGDVVTFAGDTNKYLVTAALAGGSFTLAAPGLRQTLADGVAVTVGANYTANMVFARHALHLITRAPKLPTGPGGRPADAADDIAYITDPISGLTFQVTMYRQFRQVLYIVALAWGVGCTKPEHTAILLG